MNLEDLKSNSVSAEPENTQGGFIPSITQEEPQPTTVSMTSGVAIKAGSGRTKADFSNLPEEEVEGVVDKVSPIHEILGEGGLFETYRAEKNAEYEVARQEAKDEMESRELDGEIDTEAEIDPFDFEDDGDYLVTQLPANEAYKKIDVVDTNINNIEEDDNEYGIDVADNSKKQKKVDTNINNIEEDDGEYGIIDDEDSYNKEDEENIDVEVKQEEEDDEDDQERLVLLKNIISQKIKPIKQRLDLSSYTISTKIKTTDAVIETDKIPTAKWALMSSNTVVLMKAFSGSELETLRECLEDRGNNEDYRTVLNMIYNHIVSPKPARFEKWVKTISFFDYDHLFFAIYIASFSGANYIPIECRNPKCKNKVHTYLTDNIPFMDMVKYKNDKIKNKFMELYKSESYDPTGLIISEVVPLDDRTAIGFRIPSLYGALLEPSYFDPEFTKKYASTINILPYIDNIYEINQETHMLTPYGYKIYTNNIAKSTKSRVKRYHGILKGLHPDSYNLVGGIISEINDRRTNDYITYQIPETACTYCGTVVPARENQSPIQMVFTRNRLGLLATM